MHAHRERQRERERERGQRETTRERDPLPRFLVLFWLVGFLCFFNINLMQNARLFLFPGADCDKRKTGGGKVRFTQRGEPENHHVTLKGCSQRQCCKQQTRGRSQRHQKHMMENRQPF
jgi:hypothetical protein